MKIDIKELWDDLTKLFWANQYKYVISEPYSRMVVEKGTRLVSVLLDVSTKGSYRKIEVIFQPQNDFCILKLNMKFISAGSQGIIRGPLDDVSNMLHSFAEQYETQPANYPVVIMPDLNAGLELHSRSMVGEIKIIQRKMQQPQQQQYPMQQSQQQQYPVCNKCNQQLQFAYQYNRWFCPRCQTYV